MVVLMKLTREEKREESEGRVNEEESVDGVFASTKRPNQAEG